MFVTKRLEIITGKQQFRQLVIVAEGKVVDNMQAKIDKGELEVEGVLDEYEGSLQEKYKSSLRGIISIMNRVANLESVPEEKFRDVTPDKEDVKEFEFKYGDLRVYAIKIPNGKLIVLGGYKNKQKKDFSKFRALKQQYLDSLK